MLLLFSSVTTLGWRATRRIDADEGERRVSLGQFRQVLDTNNKLIGYQVIDNPQNHERKSQIFPPVSLTIYEMNLIAGQAFARGRSKTAGLPEDLRVMRFSQSTGKMLPAEDDVERAVAKLGEYAKTRLR